MSNIAEHHEDTPSRSGLRESAGSWEPDRAPPPLAASPFAAPPFAASSLAASPLPPLPLAEHVRRRAAAMTPYPAIQFTPVADLGARAARLARGLMLRLRAWRVEQNRTREALADCSAMPVSAIKRAERFGEISLERFAALAIALGLEGELSGLFAFRRLGTPPLVLGSRQRRRRRGRGRAARSPTPRDRA